MKMMKCIRARAYLFNCGSSTIATIIIEFALESANRRSISNVRRISFHNSATEQQNKCL